MPTFIDLFAGCGGLSLGLMEAGWIGHFAVEKDPHAFKTLKHNLIESNGLHRYTWPRWLPKEPHEISAFAHNYARQLRDLRGKVDLIVGGPPCQGFSYAGRRNAKDPRNRLFREYIRIVELVRPSLILLENVKGISTGFSKKKGKGRSKAFSDRIRDRLEKHGYVTYPKLLRAMDFAVPQARPRFFMLGMRKDLVSDGTDSNPFDMVDELKKRFLKRFGLQVGEHVTVKQAISDLEIARGELIECSDSPGFSQISYGAPRTKYQRQMHGRMNGHAPNSLRLARHTIKVQTRFKKMLLECPKGVSLNSSRLEKFDLKKQQMVLLDANKPSHTLTTLPDDMLHYKEPRILTVREYARLQSFPDWFEFQGKYTTGGKARKHQCPRYTQVGNAVPPRLAMFLGVLAAEHLRRLKESSR